MKLLHTHREAEHVRIVLVALDAPIRGRADAVKTSRRVLVYLATRCGSMRRDTNWKSCWITTALIQEDLGLPNRTTVDRALKRLKDQGLIQVNRGSYRGKRFVRLMC